MRTKRVVAVAALVAAVPLAWMAPSNAQDVTVAPTTVRYVAWEPVLMEVSGPVSKVDPVDSRIVLADAVDLRVPPSVPVALADLREGTPITARYENVAGERIVTTLHVEGDAVQAP